MSEQESCPARRICRDRDVPSTDFETQGTFHPVRCRSRIRGRVALSSPPGSTEPDQLVRPAE